MSVGDANYMLSKKFKDTLVGTQWCGPPHFWSSGLLAVKLTIPGVIVCVQYTSTSIYVWWYKLIFLFNLRFIIMVIIRQVELLIENAHE